MTAAWLGPLPDPHADCEAQLTCLDPDCERSVCPRCDNPELDRTCEHCGRTYCQLHDSTVGDDGHCPNCADPFAPLDHWRAQAAREETA